MICQSIRFSGHAFERMLQRGISPVQVKNVVKTGEVIESYPDDSPFPSDLLLGVEDGEPLHVVIAHEPDYAVCYVVTVYKPDPMRWNVGFRTRRIL